MKYRAGTRRRAKEYEKAILEFWQKGRVFEKSVEGRPEDKSYVFYDGPPFITGNPHHGTLLSSIVKDAVPRFWTMRGRRVERRWGWDCHGLPAENFVEKQLGITDRREIGTKWSLEEYITKARESMVANSETWEGTIARVGRWVEFRGAYRTMDKDFMESVWWAFKTLYNKGKIFEGRKVLMYDTKFATPVSKAEVTMDNDAYLEVTDPSAYVKFRVVDDDSSRIFADTLKAARLSLLTEVAQQTNHSSSGRSGALAQVLGPSEEGLSVGVDQQLNHSPSGRSGALAQVLGSSKEGLPGFLEHPVYLLAWTTTPWTLPANMALAVNPEMEYGLYLVGEEYFILAKCLAEKVLAGVEFEAKAEFKGEELLGLKYQPVIEMPESLVEKTGSGKDTWTVVAGDFVSSESGTGVVHIAPAYGEDDYALLKKYEINFADVVNENGYYLPEMEKSLAKIGVKPTDEQGVEVWGGNKFIAKCLVEVGSVWKIEYIKHEYPFNPRSKQRIMYRAFPSWFLEVEDSKAELLAGNQEINWFPGYLKEGRFAKNIEQAPDWNLSRDRFWATAMPVWKGDKGSVRVVGSYDELYELSGVRLEDYHRPWVDEIEFEIEGEHFKRVDKVLDCWFESGAMPFAQMHYPFENKEKFEKNYPADFIVEYVGQVRAWFYYVHVLNMALFGRPAYKNVITTGTLAGNDGRKMSKSLGNYTDPNELMDQYSADSLRFLLLSSPVLAGEDFALLDKDVSDVARKLAMIWNVYDFFTMYAEVDGVDSELLAEVAQQTNHSFSGRSGALAQVLGPSKEGLSVGMEQQLDHSSSGRSGVIAQVLGPSKEGLSVGVDQQLNHSFSGRSGALARVLGPSKEGLSVGMEQQLDHSSSGRSGVTAQVNLLDRWIMSRVFELRNEITEAMEEYNIPKALSGVLPFIDDLSNWFVRRSRRRFWKSEDDQDKMMAYQTLYDVLVYLSRILAPFVPFLAEELYQKMTGDGGSVHLLDWPEAGEVDEKVLAEMAKTREIITEALALRMRKSETEEQMKVRQPLAKLVYTGEKLSEFYEQIIQEEVNVKVVEKGEEMWLDKTLTDELRKEGFVRELVRVVQAARKKAGLNVDDRIRLMVSCELDEMQALILKQETLTEELVREGNYAYDEVVKVQGEQVVISLEKN